MEETAVSKRPREELQPEEDNSLKKQKPYNHILSLLDEEEEDDSTQQDLFPLISTLQEEISSSASDAETLIFSPTLENDQENSKSNSSSSSSSSSSAVAATLDGCSQSDGDLKGDAEDDKERVMRHLLEASDDELGIPNRSDDIGLLDFGEDGFNGGDGFSSLCDGLWEFEDQTANYYAMLQSELFM